jgi:hypothetical protein
MNHQYTRDTIIHFFYLVNIINLEGKTSPPSQYNITKKPEDNLVLQSHQNLEHPCSQIYKSENQTSEISLGIYSPHESIVDHLYSLMMSPFSLYGLVSAHKNRYTIHQLETHRHMLFSPWQIMYTLYTIYPSETYVYMGFVLLQIAYGTKTFLTHVTFFSPLSWAKFTTLQTSPLLRSPILQE